MSNTIFNDKGRQNEQKSVFYPFMRILEEFMEEGKKEYLKNKNTTNKKENIKKTSTQKIVNDIARDGLLKYGRLSILYLMKKLRCDEAKAREVIVSATTHECCEWDFMEINALMPEFECCLCYKNNAS